MSTIRTFIAVEVSDEVRRLAGRLVERLARSQADVKWVEAHNLHLTLKFLGDVPDARTAEVCQAVAEVSRQIPGFVISLCGAGAFPNAGRPRTIWMGVDRGREQLAELHRGIDAALAKLGFPADGRRFHPHLTLGRVRRGGPAMRELGRLIQENERFDGATTEVVTVTVFASFLDKSGPTYQVLGRAELAT